MTINTTTAYDTLETKLLDLPEDIQIALGSTEILAKVWKIGWSYKLTDDYIELLIDEVAHVFLGITPIQEFPKKLTSQLKIAPQDAEGIIQEITTNIFAPYENPLHSLKKELVADGGVGANISQPTFTDNAPSIHPLAPPPSPTPPTTPSLSPQAGAGATSPLAINTTQAPAPASMFEEKLKRVFSMPREDSRGISGQSASLGQPPAPSSPPAPPAPQNTPPDPYRESVG